MTHHLADSGQESITTEPLQHVEVIIVGAGFAGVGLGVQLKRNGQDSFVILERAGDVGGSWRDNVYPGVACDVPSPLYSYSFASNPDWSRMYSPGGEIWDYIRETATEAGLERHLRFDHEMLDARWNSDLSLWEVTTPHGKFTGRYFVAATGHLTDPKLPNVPGLESFSGEMLHSARWDATAEIKGKRVGVVGTGASAIQVIPQIAKDAAELVVFQRSAPYIVPRNDRSFSEAEKRQFRRSQESIDALRDQIFWDSDHEFAARSLVPKYVETARTNALTHLSNQVADQELRAKLTPDYEIGCKRILLSDNYYPALQQPNVTLETAALDNVEGSIARSAAGNEFELDVLVFATGFDTWDLPSSHRVFGEGGVCLGEQWSTGMQAYNSVTVHNFPNMFMLNGPASSLGHNSIVYMIEVQIDYVIDALNWMRNNDVPVIEVTEEAEQEYADRLHEQAQSTAWLAGGCSSWYIDPRNGRLTLTWPNFAHSYRDQCADFDPAVYAQHGQAALVATS
ncbi:MAG: flavin-containing monooxygenase [Gulosibacter sp.]|uniref:flavin-containing monooxygenase n=1 Tax=Gulosibacter sp. TaxID=2817531 RepID=UPI003F8EBC96